jgi:hypothetical protein
MRNPELTRAENILWCFCERPLAVLSSLQYSLGWGGWGGGGCDLPRGGKIMSRVTWTDSGTEMLLLAA